MGRMLNALMWRALIALSVLFTGLVGGVRALSRPNPDADAFAAYALSAEGCIGLPCLMAIRPGVTSISEAYAILDAHPWVDTVDLYIDLNALAWSWSGEQPAWVDASSSGVVWVYRNIVQFIRIPTRLTLGDLALLHTGERLRRIASPRAALVYIAEYAIMTDADQPAYRIEAMMSCRYDVARFWNTPIRINMPAPGSIPPFDPAIAPNWVGERWLC
ncbi:MAG: hypothetical protein CUN53_07105 [Phototrophicales bacterium]|nr:MAG: hypothetical protein CUN53_07105 [Phototrophicales bacterium]